MAILSIYTDTAGQIGVNPRTVRIVCTDLLATITSAGYLNPVVLEGYIILPTDFVFIMYGVSSDTPGIFTPTIVNGIITLTAFSSGGASVILPTIANHIATYTNTTGTLSENAATAINGGNIQAGLSGTAGTVTSFPATAARGSLKLAAVANNANYTTTISNIAMGQSTAFSIPDPGTSTGFLCILGVPGFTTGNLVASNSTDGLLIDAGVSAAQLQLSANIIAAQSADIGGSGAGPISVAVVGMTSASVVVATVASSSNPVSVIAAVAGSAAFNITFSADPGASCIINYVVFIAAQ